ncbi:PLC-like phosphodiesterase [Podospora conica]|nr:PLC-like phosphodiesterase [Schizothecium conicum]
MGHLTIRNLSITPLELVEAERITHPPPAAPQLGPSKALFNITTRITGRQPGPPPPAPTEPPAQHDQPTTTKEPIPTVPIQPFSESVAPLTPPDTSASEQLRLTFSEPGTPRRYTLTFPGATPQSLVMTSSGDNSNDDKEFTAIFLPRSSYLTLLSSAHLSTWMAPLPSTLPLSALSIPGTHNSPTYRVALPSVRCQAVSVAAQLAGGVRFLDVRVSCPGGDPSSSTDLALVHSAFPVALSGAKYLADLLATVHAFLDANPSETVLLSLKREGTGKGTDQQLSQILARRYLAEPSAERWFAEPRIPTLGEARGKIVLVRRFVVDEGVAAERGGGFGIDGSVWPDNCEDGTCGGGLIRIQDYYDVAAPDDIDKKIEFAAKGLERAAQRDAVPKDERPEDGPAPPLFINFLSASSFFNASCWPDRIAAKINPSMIEYLCTAHGPGTGPGEVSIGDAGTGVVVMDWVGRDGDWDLCRCIVAWNARLQLRR